MMSNKIAVITGGNRGLGKNTVLSLARKNIDCVFTYRSHKDEAQQVVEEVATLGAKAVAIQLDVSDVLGFAEFKQTLESTLATQWQTSRFDYLINNAGHGSDSAFADTSEAMFDNLMNVHVKGVFFLTQTLHEMINDGGRIINLSSGLTRFTLPGKAAYATMKGAVEVLTKYLAKELAGRNIAVNVVAPGAIATDFGGGAVRDNEHVAQLVSSFTAMGRVGQADDIGPMIAQLLGDENRWVTGQRIEASGGMFL